jgi:hypothetical protein
MQLLRFTLSDWQCRLDAIQKIQSHGNLLRGPGIAATEEGFFQLFSGF